MVRVACSPLPWANTPFEYVLDDLANAAYQGVETHARVIEAFGRQPGRLRGLLEDRRLALAGAPFTAWYFDRDTQREEIEQLRRFADFLAEAGASGPIVFRTVPNPARRDMVAGEPPLLPLTRDRLARLVEMLNRLCDMCGDFGLRGAFQNRVGSFVETPDEFEEVAEGVEPSLVWLAPDLGEWQYAGGSPVALVRAHRDRIIYPRLKDFDQGVFEKVCADRQGFASFIRGGGFKELGAGTSNPVSYLLPFVDATYDGWVCVDVPRAERSPSDSAKISRDYLQEHLHW